MHVSSPKESDAVISNISHVESASEGIENEKLNSTVFVAEDTLDSHHKSKAERRLVLKADLVILPLAALIYFAAYLVSQ